MAAGSASQPSGMAAEASQEDAWEPEVYDTVQAQLQLYEQYRRAQGVSDDRLRMERARLQEELRLMEAPAPEVHQDAFQASPADASAMELPPIEQPAFELSEFTAPPWLEAPPWRTSRELRPLQEFRKHQVGLVYGEGGRRQAPVWFPSDPRQRPPLRPSPRRVDKQGDAIAHESFAPLHPVASISAAGQYAGDMQAATSSFTATALPSSERWRAASAGQTTQFMKPSARLASSSGRQVRGQTAPGCSRPTVDNLRGGFGRTQWEFD